MKTKSTMTLKEAMKELGVGDSYIFKLVRLGVLKRIAPGKYDPDSIKAYKAKPKSSSKYESRKAQILKIVNTSWRQSGHSTTINEIAKIMKISTSMAARHVDTMSQNKLLEIDRHTIYPIGLRAVLNETILEFYKSK